MKTWTKSGPVSIPDNRVMIEISGWCEEGEEFTNVPKVCPRCGSKLTKVDALKTSSNFLFVFCANGKLPDKEGYKVKPCLWCECYKLPL